MTNNKTSEVPVQNPDADAVSESVIQLIRQHYTLDARRIRRIYAGLGSRNWVVYTPQETYFVKEFISSEDAQKGKRSIEVATHCITSGIASPSTIANRAGEHLTVLEDGGLALFSYVHSDEQIDKFSIDMMAAAGVNLADTHLALSRYPAPGEDETDEWLDMDVAEIVETVDEILGEISKLEQTSEFDEVSRRLLQDRKVQLANYGRLIEPIRNLTRGVIHGDYGQKNLIVDDTQCLWVIDFGSADIFLPAYELGRAAFPPENFDHDDWLDRGLSMIKSYASRGALTRQDLVFCARAWLVQLLQSVYGVKQHYLKPHELQEDLDLFWLRRGKATATLFESLEEVEASIERIL
jgi:homoserine kinase type II